MSAQLIALAALVALLQLVSAFQVKDCTAGKDPDAKLTALNINTCPGATGDSCPFIKGKNATMTLDLETTKEFSQANVVIKAKIGPVYIPFKLDGPANACGNYGLECPSTVGQKSRIVMSLPVLRAYPSIKAKVRFELNDEQKRPIVCFEFPVQIRDQ